MPRNIDKKALIQSDLPNVTILIPVYNEESVIERRINNIFECTYPKNKLEIIVIDSGSTDKTRTIIHSKFQNTVTLITEKERKGKATAINLALHLSKGDFVILTDGATLYDKETIMHLVNPFKDNTIGAVSASYDVPNREESHSTASEHKFWLHKDNIRILESKIHSTSWLSGEACAFRKGIINKVQDDTLADDSNIALQVVSKGYRAIVSQDARFTERSPTQLTDYFKIKTRRTLGGLVETLRFKGLLFNRKYGYFGMIIFPYRFFVYLISPILSCALIVLAFLSTMQIISEFGTYATLLLGAIFLTTAFILRDIIMTYIYTQLFTIMALIWLLRGNADVRWSRSTTR
ncbi:MAG TPA: glycosyltransferase [Nitrososphaeraceae archaeon]|nr:glycosyltransferase [Nitrososphaeraceae archaeon]